MDLIVVRVYEEHFGIRLKWLNSIIQCKEFMMADFLCNQQNMLVACLCIYGLWELGLVEVCKSDCTNTCLEVGLQTAGIWKKCVKETLTRLPRVPHDVLQSCTEAFVTF